MPSRKHSESLFWSLLLTTVFAHACALRRAFSLLFVHDKQATALGAERTLHKGKSKAMQKTD